MNGNAVRINVLLKTSLQVGRFECLKVLQLSNLSTLQHSNLKNMKVIRSSDIGSYLYCRRAWWYRKQGAESANQAEMLAGTEIHHKHGRQVVAAGLTRTLATILLLIALMMLVSYCTVQIL